MLSRIAENLYWLGRYVERAENTARLLDVNFTALMEAPLASGAQGIVVESWAPLLRSSGSEEDFREHYPRADAASVPRWLAIDRRNSGSIRSSLAFARENARTLRERISIEMWEAINRSYLTLCGDDSDPLADDGLHAYCVAAREASHLFFGIADATLPRDLGWYFARAGQYLERADSTLRTLMVRYEGVRADVPVAQGVAAHRAMALLKSLSAYQAFRRGPNRWQGREGVASFLLLDAHFPRSVRFSFEVLREITAELARLNGDDNGEPQRLAGKLSAQLEFASDARSVIEGGEPGLEALLSELAELSDAIAGAYFAPRSGGGPQRQAQTLDG